MSAFVPKDKYLKINGLRLHYLDWGTKGHQPMLLLHGFMAHAHVWDDFALRFRNHYHILALDQRGHGESQWAKDVAYTLDDHFSDIYQFIEALGLAGLGGLTGSLVSGPTQAITRVGHFSAAACGGFAGSYCS